MHFSDSFRYMAMATALGGALALTACGGGGGGGSSTGSLNLSVTDGPVEQADNVWVQFSAVTFKPSDGEPFTIDIDPAQRVDLLDQQNGNSELLLENQTVPAGNYDWIRLGVDLGPGETEIVFPGPVAHDLDIPSGAQTGLKLVRGFSVLDGDLVSLTIEFDLKRSVIEAPPGSEQYKLKPALKLVKDDETGEIAATATAQYVTDNDCGTNDSLGEPIQSVYVYEGAGVTPDDLNTVDGGDIDPYSSAMLTDDEPDGIYTGTVGHLPAGDYTVAYVCDAEDDGAETDETLSFLDIRTVEVEAGETSSYDLP